MRKPLSFNRRRIGVLSVLPALLAVGCGASEPPTPAPEAAEPSKSKRIDPATLPKPTEPALAAGYDVWMDSCVICHTRGTDGAPKVTDAEAWAPRVARGVDTLYASAINGYELMPPRGDNADLSDEQLRSAVDYMLFATPTPKP